MNGVHGGLLLGGAGWPSTRGRSSSGCEAGCPGGLPLSSQALEAAAEPPRSLRVPLSLAQTYEEATQCHLLAWAVLLLVFWKPVHRRRLLDASCRMYTYEAPCQGYDHFKDEQTEACRGEVSL